MNYLTRCVQMRIMKQPFILNLYSWYFGTKLWQIMLVTCSWFVDTGWGIRHRFSPNIPLTLPAKMLQLMAGNYKYLSWSFRLCVQNLAFRYQNLSPRWNQCVEVWLQHLCVRTFFGEWLTAFNICHLWYDFQTLGDCQRNLKFGWPWLTFMLC